MTEPITDLIIETTKRIEGLETRKRNRDANTQLRFEHSVRTILIDLWKAVHCIPPKECLINKRSGLSFPPKLVPRILLKLSQGGK